MAEKLIFALVALILSAFGFGSVSAKPQRVDAVEVELIAEQVVATPGQSLQAGLRIRHDPQWHTYWRNPGDSGLPTILDLTLPGAVTAGPIQWPAPQRLPVGPLLNFGYEGEIVLPFELKLPENFAASELKIAGHAQWLVCKDVCIPGEAKLQLTLPVRPAAAAGASAWASLFESMRARTPTRTVALQADVLTDARPGQSLLIALQPWPDAAAAAKPAVVPASAEFYPYSNELISNPLPQRLLSIRAGSGEQSALEVPLVSGVDSNRLQEGLFRQAAGVLVIDGQAVEVSLKTESLAASWQSGATVRAQTIAAAPSASTSTATSTSTAISGTSAARESNSANSLSFAMAIGFALLGGLILNLMPCVFPVIGLKLLSFVNQAQAQRRSVMSHALAFAFGVLAAFWALALLMVLMRSAGQAMGWGFQLQSPAFVLAMALLFLVIGLNLAGLFEWGVPMAGLAARPTPAATSASPSYWSDLGSGALAVLVATPCTAPFMGSALGYTLSQPLALTLLVFTALGLGMAAPYVVLALQPSWTRRLPRPGPWMQTLKQLLAFPMFATVCWLLWVLVLQTGSNGVLDFGMAAILAALAAWIYGRFVQRGVRRQRFAVLMVAIIAALALWPVLRLSTADASANPTASAAPQDETSWQAWSPAALERALSSGSPVFVEFTAAWCVSCQANKKLVLERDVVRQAFSDRKVVLLRADWTSRNREISDALAGFGRNGVPLYVYYAAGDRTPRLLPELLTQDIVLDALHSVAR